METFYQAQSCARLGGLSENKVLNDSLIGLLQIRIIAKLRNSMINWVDPFAIIFLDLKLLEPMTNGKKHLGKPKIFPMSALLREFPLGNVLLKYYFQVFNINITFQKVPSLVILCVGKFSFIIFSSMLFHMRNFSDVIIWTLSLPTVHTPLIDTVDVTLRIFIQDSLFSSQGKLLSIRVLRRMP